MLKPECPVTLLQSNPDELKRLLALYKFLKPKKVMEIGSFFGGTLFYWINYGGALLDTVISLDYPVPPSDGRYAEMIESKAKWNGWREDYAPAAKLIKIEGDSTHPDTIASVSAQVPDKDLDFLFIDGGHDFKTVKSDFDNYRGLVRSGGIIAFHDVMCEGEVKQYWETLKVTDLEYLEICHPHGNGIGVIFM